MLLCSSTHSHIRWWQQYFYPPYSAPLNAFKHFCSVLALPVSRKWHFCESREDKIKWGWTKNCQKGSKEIHLPNLRLRPEWEGDIKRWLQVIVCDIFAYFLLSPRINKQSHFHNYKQVPCLTAQQNKLAEAGRGREVLGIKGTQWKTNTLHHLGLGEMSKKHIMVVSSNRTILIFV